jgi:hypothetical protein
MANDFLSLVSMNSPRTDAPTTLPSVNQDIPQLPCEIDDDFADRLIAKRAELRLARQEGTYREYPVDRFRVTSKQIGFLHVALLRAVQDTEYPDRMAWIESYKQIETGVDAAIFMTEAKLKVRHAIDFKKIMRQSNEEVVASAHRKNAMPRHNRLK